MSDRLVSGERAASISASLDRIRGAIDLAGPIGLEVDRSLVDDLVDCLNGCKTLLIDRSGDILKVAHLALEAHRLRQACEVFEQNSKIATEACQLLEKASGGAPGDVLDQVRRLVDKLAQLREINADLVGVSTGHLAALNEKAAEARREWQRAENAEGRLAHVEKLIRGFIEPHVPYQGCGGSEGDVDDIVSAAGEILKDWRRIALSPPASQPAPADFASLAAHHDLEARVAMLELEFCNEVLETRLRRLPPDQRFTALKDIAAELQLEIAGSSSVKPTSNCAEA